MVLSLITIVPGCDPDTDGVDGGGDSGFDAGTDGEVVIDDGGGDAGTDSGPTAACTGPTTGDCDVTMPTSCGAGMACVMTGSSMDGWMAQCTAAGVGGRAAVCDSTMAGGCQEGFQCVDDECRAICCTNSDCITGDFCAGVAGADAGFCREPVDCDLIAQTGCEAMAGTGCYPGAGGLQCIDAGTAGEGETCEFINTCMPGMGCIGPTGGPSLCRMWCDMGATDPCPSGFACTGVTGLPVGACTPE